MEKYKKTYITWFLILVVPPILIRLATYSGKMALSVDLAALGTIITKIAIISITIWYGLKVGMKNIWAWVLGFSTLLPIMPWISLIILLSRKTEETKNSNKSQNIKQIKTNIKS
ncbi:unnamed protein product [marine sediment metagenome]|uniref:Uncharacterized protein n=1 Tax=marine sediment metagenome TaxID=412755 RepID=X0ZGF5_9ZZZZ